MPGQITQYEAGLTSRDKRPSDGGDVVVIASEQRLCPRGMRLAVIVQERHDGRRRHSDAGVAGSRYTAACVMPENYRPMGGRHLVSAVCRPVIHDDDLKVGPNRLAFEGTQAAANPVSAVERRDDHTETRRH
jgi:hypothetical protein